MLKVTKSNFKDFEKSAFKILQFILTKFSPVEALLVAPAVVLETLVDVIAGDLLASHELEPHARVGREVDEVEAEVAGLDRLREVHHGEGGAVQDAELDRGP